MSLSVLRVDRFTSPIPIPRRRSFIVAVNSGPNGNGDRRVCQRSESFISPSHTPVPLALSSLVKPGRREVWRVIRFPFNLLLWRTHIPGLSAQRTAEVGGFDLYLVSLHM